MISSFSSFSFSFVDSMKPNQTGQSVAHSTWLCCLCPLILILQPEVSFAPLPTPLLFQARNTNLAEPFSPPTLMSTPHVSFLSGPVFTHLFSQWRISGADLTLSSPCIFPSASCSFSPTFLPHASPFSSSLPSPLPPVSLPCLVFPSPPSFSPPPAPHPVRPPPCCTRLRGVITPPTAPGPTWTPRGGTMRACCLPTGMYPCLTSGQLQTCDAPVFFLFH